MFGRLNFIKYNKDAPGAKVDERTRLELRRLANLFALSGITLALFVLRALAETLSVTFVPTAVLAAWGIVLLAGWTATLIYGAVVTFTARRWGWLVLCLIPATSVPAAVAYAWIRRQEIERAVLDDARDRVPNRSRRRRSGGKTR